MVSADASELIDLIRTSSSGLDAGPKQAAVTQTRVHHVHLKAVRKSGNRLSGVLPYKMWSES